MGQAGGQGKDTEVDVVWMSITQHADKNMGTRVQVMDLHDVECLMGLRVVHVDINIATRRVVFEGRAEKVNATRVTNKN